MHNCNYQLSFPNLMRVNKMNNLVVVQLACVLSINETVLTTDCISA